MRPVARARGATCVLALTLAAPAAFAEPEPPAAARRAKSLATCTTFDQVDEDETTVAFTIQNSCTVPVQCSLRWRLVCAPASKKRRTAHHGAARLALPAGGSQGTSVSAVPCGDDAWQLDRIQWSCTPDPD